MIGRPAPKKLTPEQAKAITSGSAKQSGSITSPKTYDPNYPVFEVPVNDKLLVYVPNHTVMDESGVKVLRADRFTSHSVRDGKAYLDVRCTGEVVSEALGWDGTCPLCNGMNECWDLYNKQYKELCESRGMEVGSPEAETALKEDRKQLLDNMAIKNAEKWITFPIVIIDTEQGSTKLKLDAENRAVGTPVFYSVRVKTYEDTWGKAFDAIDEDEDGVAEHNPAGRFAILNFQYDAKGGQHNKRDSARNLKVAFTEKANLKDYAAEYDKLTEDWTPEKAQEVLVRNAVRSMDEQIAVADQLLKATRDKLDMLSLSAPAVAGVAGGVQGSADAALANFGATPVAENTESTGSTPPTADDGGEMPKNVGVDAD